MRLTSQTPERRRSGDDGNSGHPATRDRIWWAALAFILLTLVATRNDKIGFEAGHHGWVSSHTLAISEKATLKNGFVGYSLKEEEANGEVKYRYFDRAPVFFSAFLHAAVSTADSLAMRVRVGRMVMDLIFFASILVAYLIARTLMSSHHLALCAAVLAFSSYPVLYYKDMVNFDQPAVLGILGLVWAVLVFRKKRLPFSILLITAIAAVSIGRGYAPLGVLVAFVLVEAYELTRDATASLRSRLRRLVGLSSIQVLAVCLAWLALMLSYNVVIESVITGRSIAQTSVVESALRRGGFSRVSSEEAVVWPLIRDTGHRLLLWTFPVASIMEGDALGGFRLTPLSLSPMDLSPALKPLTNARIIIGLSAALMAAGLLLATITAIQTRRFAHSFILVAGGLVWYFGVPRLTYYHEFTAMYLVGIPIVAWTGLLNRARRAWELPILLVCLASFALGNARVQTTQNAVAESVNAFTTDFDRIRAHLADEEKTIHFLPSHFDIVPGARYAVGFYLPQHRAGPLATSEYVVSGTRRSPLECLTPENRRVFLFRR